MSEEQYNPLQVNPERLVQILNSKLSKANSENSILMVQLEQMLEVCKQLQEENDKLNEKLKVPCEDTCEGSNQE